MHLTTVKTKDGCTAEGYLWTVRPSEGWFTLSVGDDVLRHEVAPHCASVEDGIELGVFPADCPYVRDVEGYVGPVDVSNLF
jgi:hypothetical protein